MPEYHIDKGEYWCKCKAQRPEYFPCYDNEDRDCSCCIYGEKKVIVKIEFEGDVTTQILKPNMIGHYNELTEVMNACCSCGCLTDMLTTQATEEGMMCFSCYHARYDQHE